MRKLAAALVALAVLGLTAPAGAVIVPDRPDGHRTRTMLCFGEGGKPLECIVLAGAPGHLRRR